MSKITELLARIPEIQAQAKQRAERNPWPGVPLPKNVVRLPLWPDAVRAVPNGFLRSALFGAISKGRRRYINGEDLAAIDGLTIRYKGERLDQGDLDVWQTVLHTVRLQELGSQCRITSYALLKLMGKTDTGKNRVTLQNRIERLVANALTVKQGRYSYIGSLISFAAKDEETQEWVIELDPRLRPLFAADQFTQIDWNVRRALDGKQLAQWLHGFYATHAKPFPMKIETLLSLSGSENEEPRSSRQKLRKALDALTDVSKTHGQTFSYDIRVDLVHVGKSLRVTQRRHLAKKDAKNEALRAVKNFKRTG
jgi:TrfA protein